MALQMIPEFAFLLSRENVPEDIVERLAAAGIVAVRTFANLVDDVIGLRELAKKDFKLDPEALGDRVKVAALICAWKATQAHTTEMVKQDACA